MAIASLQNALSWIKHQGWQLIKPREIHPSKWGEVNSKPPAREARRNFLEMGWWWLARSWTFAARSAAGKIDIEVYEI